MMFLGCRVPTSKPKERKNVDEPLYKIIECPHHGWDKREVEAMENVLEAMENDLLPDERATVSEVLDAAKAAIRMA
jgi:hypothetical protein